MLELFSTEGITEKPSRGVYQALPIIAFAGVAAFVVTPYLGSLLPFDGAWRVVAMLPIGVAVFLIAIPLSWIPLLILILVVAVSIDWLLRVVLWLFRRYNLSGTMLVAGAALFVASKAISLAIADQAI